MAETAEAFLRPKRNTARKAVWPYYYAGTMGLVMRDGINRLRHAKKYSGMYDTFCVALSWPGYLAGCGRIDRLRSARDAEIRSDRHLGHQSGEHAGQCHDPCRDRARRLAAPRSPASMSTTPAR